MQIPGSTPDKLAITIARTAPAIRAWQVGQLLRAVAQTDARDGAVTLRIGDASLQATTPLPLRAGQVLTLEVVRLDTPPLLRVLNDPPNIEADIRNAALRQALPRQQTLTPLLANLAHLAAARADAPGRAALSRELISMSTAVFTLLPEVRRILGERGLRQALLDSGLFLESKLARLATDGSPPGLETDLKAALLRLERLLRQDAGEPQGGRTASQGDRSAPTADPAPPESTSPAPPAPPLRGAPPIAQGAVAATLAALDNPRPAGAELLRQVEGALARLQLSQLASVPAADGSPLWAVELPLRNGSAIDLFDLRVQEDHTPGRPPDENRRWVVHLAFDLAELGPVRARIQLDDQRVSTVFQCERASTADRFQRELDRLRDDLAQAGLIVGELASLTGIPAPAAGTNPAPGPLLDDHA